MNYEIKLATVVDTNTLSKKGIFQALLYKTNIQVPVVMTTPMGSHPTSIEYGTFAGLFGNPTLWTQVLIKKIDESGYWYFDSIPGVQGVLPTLKSSIFPTLTNSQIGSLVSTEDSVNAYSHSRTPQKYGIISPLGNKLVLSDSQNAVNRSLFAKIESKTKQRALFNSSTGISVFKNRMGDGLLVTSKRTKSKYGPRSIRLSTFGNITEYTTNGKITLKVGSAGRVFNIINQAIKNFNQAGIPSDNDVGSINVESYENDITLRVNSKATGRRIFIDATNANGLVSIKAGSGGVEVFTDGQVDVNCGGDFNVKAGGNINIQAGKSIHLNPGFDQWPGKTSPTKDNKELAEDSVS